MQATEQRLDLQALWAIVKRIPAYTRTIYALYKSPEVTTSQKAALSVALGYLISPIELIPGFIPVAGQLDDILVVLGILWKVVNALPPEIGEPILADAGISKKTVKADLDEAGRAARIIAAKTGKYAMKGLRLTWRGIKAVNRSIWAFGRGVSAVIQDRRGRPVYPPPPPMIPGEAPPPPIFPHE